jgi:serine/threonine protein kinase
MEEFALKIVKMNAKNKEEAKRHINNLKSEISVLKKLNHPNIIKYYSFDISPDN